MARKILVPIDFRVASLNTLKLALETEEADEVQVLLLFATQLSNSITELLFHSPAASLREKMTPEFREALSILSSRYERKFVAWNIKEFHGKNVSAMAIFLEANGIEAAYIPKTYPLQLKGVVDPCKLLKACRVPVHELEWNGSIRPADIENLTSFFN
jgi:hypothetical protein